ncbi:MAG: DNA polymerase III subunit gamma/tau [Bacillota bacterium]|nr:DNA polymerase III subunit gamma/tau [Bacillota bacterium]
MAYTALYRKFRPQTFSGVIGQEHIVRTLKNQMRSQRVSHAYLFCGTRGTGKTSTAKIFARAINCLEPTEDGEPCNQCALCQDILAGRSVNVIEIDAASNNSVDDIREIREEVKYPPTQGRFKVYIIDEVHMLSTSAFNALLKTLEEPPAHVIFILATTDPQKMPATILSRVQRFDFRRITTEMIADTMMGYLSEEGHRATPEAVRYVAQLGDGSMRDSLSILDQCLAFFSGEEVTLDKVLDIMGAVDQTVFFEMTDAISRKDAKRAMTLVEEMMASGRDVKQFVTEMLRHLRNLLLTATIPDAGALLELSAENTERMQAAAKSISAEELMYLIGKFSDLQSEMKWSPNERILLEVELMKLCAPWTEKDVTTLAARLGELERKVSEGVQVVTVAAAEGKPAEKPKPKRKPPALPEDRKQVACFVMRSEISP